MITKNIYWDMDNSYPIDLSSIAKQPKPHLEYTTQPELIIHLRNADNTVWSGLNDTDLAQVALDDDWDHDSVPFALENGSAVVVDGTNAKITVSPLDCYTTTFRDGVSGSNYVTGYLEVQITATGETQPSLVVRIPVECWNVTDPQSGAGPSEPAENYYNKTQVDSLIAGKSDKPHDIDDNAEHGGVSGAVENNLMSFDANGLPKDAGVVGTNIHTRLHALEDSLDHSFSGTEDAVLTQNSNFLPKDSGMELVRFQNNDVDTGTETVFSMAEADGLTLHLDYVAQRGANSRAGSMVVTVNGSGAYAGAEVCEYTEWATQQIGSAAAADLALSFDLSANMLRMRAAVIADDWDIKGYYRRVD